MLRRLAPLLLAGLLVACAGSAAEQGSIAGLLPTPTPVAATPAVAATPIAGATSVPGGTWTRPLDDEPDSLNPVFSNNRASTAIVDILFPKLIKRHPFTGQFVADGAMAERWEASPDGLTYTFNLRPGVTWSDGDPVDAADFQYTYGAISSALVESPHKDKVDNIARIDVLDPLTLRILFKEARCDILADLQIGWAPSHLFEADFGNLATSSFNTQPAVSAGPFLLRSWVPGEGIVLERNARYWQGAPQMERLIFRVAPDLDSRPGLLLGGQIDETPLKPLQLNSIQGNERLALFSSGDDSYDFLALNLANPENPQPGRDDTGALVAQEPHPVLADRRVREALAHAIDYDAILNTVYLKRAYPLAANVLPVVAWAHDPGLQPYTYDPNLARQLLEEAGWIDTNSDGIRERNGKLLTLSLISLVDNPLYGDLATLIEDELTAIGIYVAPEALEMPALLRRLLGQTFDLVLLGWSGLGPDPDDSNFWSSQTDLPASGFNFTSYQNVQVEQLLRQGATVAGCRPEDRAPIYKEIQRLIRQDLPYIFIGGWMRDVGYSLEWGGVQPGPWDFYWNINQWYQLTPER